MKDNLLVIESPNKINTLKKYLGTNFVIMATIGHIRNLSRTKMGFNMDDYSPMWIIPKEKGKFKGKSKAQIISEIRKAAKKSKNIYLASDPDREGEAIAWHVFEILGDDDKKKCKRITFNEISQTAVSNALKNPRDIDLKWVGSQFARRILDRMIGFRLSQLVQNFLSGDSAGRVQTVALKFLQEREEDIASFKEETWWTLDVILENNVPVILFKLNNDLSQDAKSSDYRRLEEASEINFTNKEFAERVKNNLQDKFVVSAVSKPKFSSMFPKEPYKTSTLQQDGISKLSWSSRKVTAIAQKLYEGLMVGGEYKALISYPRTDSVRISEDFQQQVEKFIRSEFGNEYVGAVQRRKNKTKINIQDAHEAIRPIDINLTPDLVHGKIDDSCYVLYKLIWARSVAAFMSPAKFSHVRVCFLNNGCEFYAVNRNCEFDGYQRVYSQNKSEEKKWKIPLEDFTIGKSFLMKESKVGEHKTLPPSRYSQASLIAALEDAGIGRPSTYNVIVNVALERGYAELENKRYVLTDLGKKVVTQLESYFPGIINKEFTRGMEEKLDQIADGKEEYQAYLRSFWPQFDQATKEVYKTMMSKKLSEKTEIKKVGRLCPNDKGDLVYRESKKSKIKFIGCSNFPECKYHEWLTKPKPSLKLDTDCPKCGKNKLIQRIGRQNKPFIGCSGFPNCLYTKKISKTESEKIAKNLEKQADS